MVDRDWLEDQIKEMKDVEGKAADAVYHAKNALESAESLLEMAQDFISRFENTVYDLEEQEA